MDLWVLVAFAAAAGGACLASGLRQGQWRWLTILVGVLLLLLGGLIVYGSLATN